MKGQCTITILLCKHQQNNYGFAEALTRYQQEQQNGQLLVLTAQVAIVLVMDAGVASSDHNEESGLLHCLQELNHR